LIGQRYDIVVEASADLSNGPNFWIHAQYCNEPALMPTNQIGVIRYDTNNKSEPYTPPLTERILNFGCNDPSPDYLIPVVSQEVGVKVNELEPQDYLKVYMIGLLDENRIDDPSYPIHTWVLKDQPLYIDWTDPSLKKLALDSNTTFPPEANPLYLDYDTGDWVYFVITSNYTVDKDTIPNNISIPITLTPSVHPMHLHGHDFAILAMGDGPYTEDTVLNLKNPARRDVVDIPIGGYVLIAFQVDNPGAWLMHCHIAFHASDGLALQFIEQPNQIKPLMENSGVLPDFEDRCNSWKSWYSSVNIPNNVTQADSGV
jgi:hypothetical protein